MLEEITSLLGSYLFAGIKRGRAPCFGLYCMAQALFTGAWAAWCIAVGPAQLKAVEIGVKTIEI